MSAICYMLFALFLLDRAFDIYGGEVRYGMRTTMLFFGHPTYLAGCCAFLIALLSLYGMRRHRMPIVLCSITLLFTLRAKAIGVVVAYVLLVRIVYRGMRVKWWHIALIGACAVLVALPSFEHYFVKLARRSARSVMLLTSLKILREYWPIGTGFGTYGSHSAAVSYSPVYVMYEFNRVYDLSRSNPRAYFDDQFWPIIFGQTGFIGTCAYLVYLRSLYMRVRTIMRRSREAFLAAMTCFLYLLISSAAEPAFNNTIAVPLALVMGMAFASSPRYDRAMSGSVDAEAKVEAEAKAEAEVKAEAEAQVDAEALLDTEATVDAETRPARKRRLVWERRLARKRRPARRHRTNRRHRANRRRRTSRKRRTTWRRRSA